MNKKWIKNGILGLALVSVCVMVGCGFAAKEKEKNSDAVVETKQVSKKSETNKPTEESEEPEETRLLNENITCIGDSVMLGAQAEMENRIENIMVDARESRQLVQARDLVDSLKNEDKLGGRVVIGLGTNGIFSEEEGQKLLDEIGSERKIYWVTAYGAHLTNQEAINEVIQSLAEKNENVTLIRWDEHANSHSEWFYNDGIHLNGEGRVAYAELLRTELEKE
ncbi:hypothetical protein SAMN02910358_00920 [Lachnospiraceae bacterium XBB1006]|nr:hypothetical protein SAMN02910358_00920 [Lachnospiraceae bacterium XBB1006]